MFRHVLTGKYLSWDPNDDEQGLSLSESLNDFLKDSKNIRIKGSLLEMEQNIKKLGTKPIR